MRALALALLASAAQAQTGSLFVHGSWVNVRDTASPTARVIEQLSTNTPVDVSARQGEWCQLNLAAGKTGFVACKLLGAKPLTLAEAGANAARAFWVAPSPNRLAAYGLSLTPPPALTLDALKKTLKYGDTVRFPPVAEFEAAKKRMQAGVKLDPALEIAARAPADPLAALKGYKLRPAPIKPSLFRTQADVALVSEQDADGLAAVAGSRVSLTPAGLPTAWHGRHDGPEIEGLTGFWDVGHAVLKFEPALTLYSVAANGLVGAAAVRALPLAVGGEGHYCGAHYLGKSLPEGDAFSRAYTSQQGTDVVLQRGYPVLKDGSELLLTLAVPPERPLRQSARVKVQSERVRQIDNADQPGDAERLKALQPQLVLREIDLDGDGVADVLQVEVPAALGHVSRDLVLRRSWFLNINGRWFAAGDWEDQDCT